MENKSPGLKRRRGLLYSLRTRMLVSFGLLLVAALVLVELAYNYGVPFAGYSGMLKEHRDDTFQNLNLVADLKKERLLTWLNEKKDDSAILSESLLVRQYSARAVSYVRSRAAAGDKSGETWNSLKQEKFHRDLVSILHSVLSAHKMFLEIEIADSKTGIVIASTTKGDLGESVADKEYFINIPSTGEVYIRFQKTHGHGHGYVIQRDVPMLHISRAIKLQDTSTGGRAILLMHIEPDGFIQPLLHTGGGLGATGEALLVDQDARILSKLKHPLPDGKNAVPLEYRIESKAAVLAARGHEGIISAADYRGVPVLAAYRHLSITPETGWGLVVKKDLAEVFAPQRKAMAYTTAVGVSVILLALIVVYYISMRLSHPLRSLSEAAHRIEGGDFNARAEVSTSGEIGVLSQTFNLMAEQVQHRHTDLEHRLKMALQGSSITLFNQDRELRYTWVYNPAPGLSVESVLGRTDEELVSPENAADLTAVKRRVLETGVREQANVTFKVSGKPSVYYLTVEPQFDKSQDIIGITGVSTDITQSRLMEEDLRFQKQIMENLAEGISIVRLSDGLIIFTNSEFERLFGYDPGEMFGKDASILNAPSDKSSKDQAAEISESINNRGYWHGEIANVKKDGTVFWCFASVSVFDHISHGKVAVSVHTDITGRLKMEEEMQKAQKLESVGLLAGGIAHDFNNLLQSLFYDISMARRSVPEDSETSRLLEETEKNLMRTKHLTRQLLTFSRGGEPVKKTLSLPPLLRDSVKFALSGSNTKEEVFVAHGLMPVEADEGQLNQVIHNLVINADHAMPGGGTIKVRAENITLGPGEIPLLKEGKYVALYFSDTGVGIPEDHLPKVFDPFFTTKQKGSGLGLASAYSIIKKHGGHIMVNSKPARGTTFTVYLPASDKDPADKRPRDKGLATGKGRVLVMDDEESITEAGCKLIKSLGYECHTASDGKEALRMYKKARASGRPFDVVMLDLTVPGGMGAENTMNEMLKVDPGVKAIVASGYADDPVMAECWKYGFKAALAKPFGQQEISEALSACMKDA